MILTPGHLQGTVTDVGELKIIRFFLKTDSHMLGLDWDTFICSLRVIIAKKVTKNNRFDSFCVAL